jgi:sugar/nucleoside kinase (ribokinase family)
MDLDLLVVGDANPDVIVSGAPRAPEFGQREQLVDTATLTLGGSGAITACAAARLGLRTAFAGRVGDDPAGAFALDALTRAGVDVSACVVDPSSPTALTVALVDGTDRAMLTAPGGLDRFRAGDVPVELVRRARHLHASSYFLLPRLADGLPALFKAAREAGATTSLDTNDDPAGRWDVGDVLPETDVLLPNDREALALAGGDDVEDAVRVLATHDATPVVKCGGAGAVTIDAGTVIRVPARPAAPVDTIGAGDTFNAGFIAARLRGLPLRRCLEVAVAAGTLSTRAAGGTAALPTWEEVL